MIGLKDNLTLSVTKLRVRRVRLAITIIVSGLIFTVLVFASLIIRGITGSLNSFVQEGLLDHYATTVQSQSSANQDFLSDPAVIARAKAINTVTIAAEVKEAKRLNVPFDPTTAPSIESTDSGQGQISDGPPDGTSAGSSQNQLDPTNPAVQQAIDQLVTGLTPKSALALAAPFHPTAAYESFAFVSYLALTQFSLTPIINGQEESQDSQNGPQTDDSVANFENELTAFSGQLLEPFTLPGTSLTSKPGQPIPIVAPIDAAEKLLHIAAEPANAKPAAQIARLAEIRSKAKNLIFESCYRNSSAMSLQSEAAQQAADIAAHKSDPTYQQPDLIYGQPTAACQPTLVTKDTRPAAEKAADTAQDQFNQEFGTPAPVTSLMKFKIVGIEPVPGSLDSASGLAGLVTSFFSTSLGEGWFIPWASAQQDPNLGAMLNDPFVTASGLNSIYVDFGSRQNQKAFITAKGCGDLSSGPPNCSSGHYLLSPFGNPLATISDAAPAFNQAKFVTLVVIAILAGIIMMGTIGKVIADSRKETSVFRAVGAKRLDIVRIYLLYTALLASIAYLVAAAIAIAFALYIEFHYRGAVSAQAVLAFNSPDLNKTFHLIGFNIIDLAEIYIYVVALSFISAALPLLGAIKRNPAKDMREE